MAVKSIIEIDVQDQSFKKFVELFGKFQEALNDMPGAWKESEKAIDDVKEATKETGNQVKLTINFITKQTQEQNKLRLGIEQTRRSMVEFGRSTANVLGTIKDITFFIGKWGSLAGFSSFLLGAGGLFGYTSLASSTASTRRSAQQLGLTPGQLQAANITYERVGDVESILGRIADIKEDVAEHYLLQRFGISAEDIRSKSAADLLQPVLEGVQARYRSLTPDERRNQAHGEFLTQYGISNLRVFGEGGISPEELSGLGPQYRQRVSQLGASDATGRAFADFIANVNAAGTAIKDRLADKLVELSGPLGNIIDAFKNLILTGINSPGFKSGIESFAKYIQEMSVWLGTEESKKTFKDFIENITSVVAGLGRMAAWLASWFPSRSPRQGPEFGTGEFNERYPWMQQGQPMSYSPQATGGINFSGAVGGRFGRGAVSRGSVGSSAMPISGGPGVWGEHFSALEGQYGLPAGLINGIYQLESGGGRNMGPSRSGAIGPFQFMPATARWLGLEDPMDTASSANAAARFMQYLMNRFSGDLEMAAASYNWGEGNVRRQVSLLGPRWREGLPEETRNYINRLMTGVGPNTGMLQTQSGQSLNVSIYNATGSNTIVSLTGLAQGSIA
jgi:hypothetical protein